MKKHNPISPDHSGLAGFIGVIVEAYGVDPDVLTDALEEAGARFPWYCLACNIEWFSRSPERPTSCPKCRSKYWDREQQSQRWGHKNRGIRRGGAVEETIE